MEAKLIGSAVSEAVLDATAGHPDGKGLRMMIAAEPAAQSRIGFDHRRTAELAAPDDQRLIEQAPSFEVGNESGTRLIGVATVFAVVADQIGVRVPAFMINIHET